MRRWYDTDNLSFTSDDGFIVFLDPKLSAFRLYDPDYNQICCWLCEDLRNELNDPMIPLYTYVLRKAEERITIITEVVEAAALKAINEHLICTRKY